MPIPILVQHGEFLADNDGLDFYILGPRTVARSHSQRTVLYKNPVTIDKTNLVKNGFMDAGPYPWYD